MTTYLQKKTARSMEGLRALLSNKEQLCTKNLQMMDKAVGSALSDDAEGAMKCLSDFFFGAEAGLALQTFAMHTRESIKGVGKMDVFCEMTGAALRDSFWEAEVPNFEAAANALVIHGGEFLFAREQAPFVRLVVQKLTPESAILAASKLIEAFLMEFKEPSAVELSEEFGDRFAGVLGQSNSFSMLASVVLNVIEVKVGFDGVFALLRSLAKMLNLLLSESEIEKLFTDGDSELKVLLRNVMSEPSFVLLITILSRDRKNSAYADFCFEKCKAMLGENSSPVERIFGYNILAQIAVSVSSLSDLTATFMGYLLRDFDSSNNLITSALKNVYKTIIKQAKATKTVGDIAKLMMEKVESLTWHAKVKTWIVPLILPFIDIHIFSSLIGDRLVTFAQSPTDAGFVSKCVKSASQTPGICEALIESCLNASVGLSCDQELVALRPILEPIFEHQPKQIAPAFAKLRTNEKFLNVWLRFECLCSSPRSKWPVTSKEIGEDIRYAWTHGNWDLRASSLTVLALAGLPIDDYDFEWIADGFENLMYFDSPKHIRILTSSFELFVSRMQERMKSKDSEKITLLMKKIIGITARHAVPSYLSGHRNFALDMAISAIAAFPKVIDPCDFLAFASVMWDANSQLCVAAANLVQRIIDENPDQDLFRGATVVDKMKIVLRSEIVQEEVSKEPCDFDALLKECATEEDWESQCRLFQEVVDKVDKRNPEQLEAAARCLFEIIFNTRKLGITCQGQTALETIARKIPEPRLSEITAEWTERILAILDGFDMENMRRSAALPYLAQSILRLQPPDLMRVSNSVFNKLVGALVNNIETTTSSSESTNSLNVIRAILTDKVTSAMAEAFLPAVFVSIFKSCERFSDWDSTAAANLCLAAVIRKVLKKNYAFESEQSLSLDQFLTKMPGARDSLKRGLAGGRHHLIYLSLIVMCTFTCVCSDNDLVNLAWSHIGNKDSRLRRAAARAVVNATSQGDQYALFSRALEGLAKKPASNLMHGFFMVLKQLLLVTDPPRECTLPMIDIKSLPPFVWNDFCFVAIRMGHQELVPTGHINIDDFYFDEVAVFIHRKAIEQDVSMSALVALILRIDDQCPQDLAQMLKQRIVTDDMKNVDHGLLNTGLDYLHDHEVPIANELLVRLIKQDFPPHILANLLHFLAQSNPSTEQLQEILPIMKPLAYNLGEDMTPVHVSIAECLPLILFDPRGYVIALRLLIDDIPRVRTLAMKAVSAALKTEFSSEIVLFRQVMEKLATIDSSLLLSVAVQWLQMIEERQESDTHGEALTVLVDEFFMVREIFKVVGIEFTYWPFPLAKLLDIRMEFVKKCLTTLEKVETQ